MKKAVFIIALIGLVIFSQGKADAQKKDKKENRSLPAPDVSITIPPLPSLPVSPPVSITPIPTNVEAPRPQVSPTIPVITPTPTRTKGEDNRDKEEKEDNDKKAQDSSGIVLPVLLERNTPTPTPEVKEETAPVPTIVSIRETPKSVNPITHIYRTVLQQPMTLLQRSLPQEFYVSSRLSFKGNIVLLSLALVFLLSGYVVLRGMKVIGKSLRKRANTDDLFHPKQSRWTFQ